MEAMLQEAVARAREFLRPKPSGASKKKAAKSGTNRSAASAKKRKSHKTGSAGAKKRSVHARTIKPVSAMKLSEFKKMPKGTPAESVVRWVWKSHIKTPSGNFGVDLFTDDNEPLDDQMLKLAEDLVEYAQAHSDYIRQLIYGH